MTHPASEEYAVCLGHLIWSPKLVRDAKAMPWRKRCLLAYPYLMPIPAAFHSYVHCETTLILRLCTCLPLGGGSTRAALNPPCSIRSSRLLAPLLVFRNQRRRLQHYHPRHDRAEEAVLDNE